MNVVAKIFTDMSDADLKQAISEIREDSITGIIREGKVREYAEKVREITKQALSNVLWLTQVNMMQEAAYRWIS